MFRLGYFLSLLLVLTLACSTLSSPVANPVEPVQEIATEAPALLPQNTESPTQEIVQTSELPNSALVDFYDPARNPADDLEQAIVVAQKENKRIMLELGGDWCIWCKYMDDFYKSHPDILQARAENYVLVKINVSEENANEEFLSQFPEAAGYPHIYILESDGTFLHSQNTVDLEDGADSYVPEVFMTFLQKWAPVK
jgi:thiol:disulfide interchange protein